MTQNEIIALAREAGFEEYDCGLSGNSELDEMLYVGEYPIGEAVFKFAALVADATKERCAQVCDGLGATFLDDSEGGGAFACAEAIRNME